MTSTSSTTAPSNPASESGASHTNGGAGGVVDRVTDEAPAQATRVIGDAKTQLSDATHRTLGDLRTQAEDRAAQAAQGLRGLSSQVDALVTGRPDEAGNLTGIVQTLGQHANDFADRLDSDGVQGVVDDVSRFGRQHPWAFLGLSLGAGFLIGRVVRTTAAVAGDGQLSSGPSPAGSPALSGEQASSDAPASTGTFVPGVDR